MRRLSVRLTLAFVGLTLVTTLLLVVPQLRGIARENVALPPEERPTLTPSAVGRALLAGGAGQGSYSGVLATLRGVEVQVDGRTVMLYTPDGTRRSTWVAALPGGPALRDLPLLRWDEARLAAGPVPPPEAVVTDDDSVSRSTLLAYVRGSLERRTAALVGSAVLALGLAVGLALLLTRLIARPIEGVTAAASRIAAGDLSARIPTERGRRSGSETDHLAASFNAMADSLQALEENRRAMVADIAHELRTPLTVMRGRLEAMEDGVVDLDLAEVRDLHAQVLVLSRLVEDLRTLSLADAGRLSLRIAEVDLADLARLAVAGYRVQADAKQVRIDVSGPATAPVCADRERMMQVIGNLLDNALRHTPEGGSVRVSVAPQGRTVVLEVRDTGPGIPDGHELRIFERFVRADDARARFSGGSGIGLAIVKALVELHRGVVAAGNGAGGGAVFRVELPA